MNDKRVNLINEIIADFTGAVNWPKLWSEVDGMERRHAPQVMRMLYEHDGKRSSVTLREIGEVLGVSAVRVGQVKNHAIRTLRHPVRWRRYATRIELPQEVTQ